MSRKNGYNLTTANLKAPGLTNAEYQAQRLEIAATELLESKKVKYSKGKKKAHNPGKRRNKNWPGKIPYDDYKHMQSIAQEIRSA